MTATNGKPLQRIEELLGALHLLADSAEARGDVDLRNALRLLARDGEAALEELEAKAGEALQED